MPATEPSRTPRRSTAVSDVVMSMRRRRRRAERRGAAKSSSVSRHELGAADTVTDDGRPVQLIAGSTGGCRPDRGCGTTISDRRRGRRLGWPLRDDDVPFWRRATCRLRRRSRSPVADGRRRPVRLQLAMPSSFPSVPSTSPAGRTAGPASLRASRRRRCCRAGACAVRCWCCDVKTLRCNRLRPEMAPATCSVA